MKKHNYQVFNSFFGLFVMFLLDIDIIQSFYVCVCVIIEKKNKNNVVSHVLIL